VASICGSPTTWSVRGAAAPRAADPAELNSSVGVKAEIANSATATSGVSVFRRRRRSRECGAVRPLVYASYPRFAGEIPPATRPDGTAWRRCPTASASWVRASRRRRSRPRARLARP
jgi:hypothetical protein